MFTSTKSEIERSAFTKPLQKLIFLIISIVKSNNLKARDNRAFI